jgi:serine/threonine-protein kinase
MGTRHAYPGGPALGDAGYAAPELFAGEPPGPAADVWAAGVILHEMLAGRAPFRGSAKEVKDAVVDARVPTLEQERPDVPPALATIARRCLARAPGDRFKGAQELAEALHVVAPDAPSSRAVRSSGPPAALVAGLVVLVLLGLAASALLLLA